MLTALDAPESALDEHERNFVAQIREHGWFGTHVFADDDGPGFTYTTGFWVTLGQPEVIMFGMKSDIAHDVMWDIFRHLKAGKTLPVRTRTDDVFGNLQACLFPMDKAHYAEHLGWSKWFYAGDAFPCLQLVWPDRGNVFPWEAGFDPTMVGCQSDVADGGWGALR